MANNDLALGIQIASDAAQIAAPIVSVYNPAVGAAMATLAPVVTDFVIKESQIIMNLRTDMSRDEMVAALRERQGALQALAPFQVKPPAGKE